MDRTQRNNAPLTHTASLPQMPTKSLAERMASEIKQNPLSVYIGRIVSLPDGYKENGMVYVDVNALDGEIKKAKTQKDSSKDWTDKLDLEMQTYGYRKAMMTRTMWSAVNLWENPPTNYYTGSLTGNGSITISNYMFDPLTMTWISTVSAALNAIGIVNVPPIVVSLSETGIPMPQVNVDLGQIADEAFTNAFNSMTDLLSPDNMDSVLPSIEIGDLIDGIKVSLSSTLASTLSAALANVQSSGGGSSLMSMLGNQAESVSSLIPQLKQLYNYDALIEKRDVLKEALTEAEGEVVKKLTELEKTAKTQLSALQGKVSSEVSNAVAYLTKQILDILIGVISPIAQKITSVYNEAIEKIRSEITTIIDKRLKPPLKKAKKKLVDIMARVVQPVINKLPGPARLAASLALKPVLNKLIDKLVGFLADAIKKKLKELFNLGKDKIISLIVKQFNGLKPEILSALSGDFSLRNLSKMEWIMDTDVGGVIKELPTLVEEFTSSMDVFYNEISDLMIPDEHMDIQYAMSELLTSFYRSMTIVKTDSGTGLGLWIWWDANKVKEAQRFYDPIRGGSYTDGDGYGKSLGWFCNGTQRLVEMFGSISNPGAPTYAGIGFFYALDTAMLALIEHLTPSLERLNAYGEQLLLHTNTPSESIKTSMGSLPDTLLLSTSQRDIVETELLSKLESCINSSIEIGPSVNKDTFKYVCDLLGLPQSEVFYDASGLPYIKENASIFPPYYDYHTGLLIIDNLKVKVNGKEYHLSSEHWFYCRKRAQFAISEFLASVYVAVNGGVNYTQTEYGKFQTTPFIGVDGTPYHTYSENKNDSQGVKARKNSAYIVSDPKTGILLELREVFTPVKIMEYEQYESKGKTRLRINEPDSGSIQVMPSKLVNTEFLDLALKNGWLSKTVNYIPITREQAEVLTEWKIFRFDGAKDPEDSTQKVPVGIELEEPPEDGISWKNISMHGLMPYYKKSDGTKVYMTYQEFMSSRTLPDTPDFQKSSGYLSAKGVHYLYPEEDPKGCQVVYRDIIVLDDKDSDSVATTLMYWKTEYTAELDDDGNKILDDDGHEILVETSTPEFVKIDEIVPMAESITWKSDDNSPEVDMSPFCYIHLAEKSPEYPSKVMMLEDFNGVMLCNSNVNPKDSSSYQRQSAFRTNACKELIPYCKSVETLSKGEVPKRYPARSSYRKRITNTWETKSEKYTSIQDIHAKTTEVVKSTYDSCKEAVRTALDTIDWVTVNLEEPLRSDAVQKTMDMLVSYMESTVSDVSEYSEAFNDVVKGMLSNLGDAASKVVQIDGLMEGIKKLLKGTEALSSVMNELAKFGDMSTKINDTFDALSGNLESSLSTALAGAVGPSMSQSVSFGEYDMSLTEKPHSQMPWKHDLDEDHFLKVGDLVLLLAIGNSTDRLYIVDVPKDIL